MSLSIVLTISVFCAMQKTALRVGLKVALEKAHLKLLIASTL